MSQEVFYPINSPLINYFFYKAPFVSNAYVLTGFDINNGGSGYAVNDVIVSAGGTYTSPAVFQVTGVNSGVITLAIITNDGKYTVTPSSFTQAATNGSGTGATFDNLVFTANILPNGVNVPLAGGFLFFYADEDHTLQLPTYSDVSDPNNPVVNTNPIQLGASGECPLFYLQNRLYYVVITDYTGDQADPVHTVEHYNPADQQVSGGFNNNFVANPQFNFPIQFWKETDGEGEINSPSTFVAWGCEFIEDANTTTDNNVTFNVVSGLEIEGHPINELVLDSDDVSSGENTKDFRWTIGSVDINAEGNMTFSGQMMSKTSSNISTVLKLERFFGENGSPPEIITLTTFTVTSTRQKFTFSFILPSIIGKVIGDGNYLAIRLEPGLRTVCTFGMTNIMVLPGNIANPVFVDEPQGVSKSQILGVSTDINSAGLGQNFSPYFYADGDIFPLPDTGAIVLITNGTEQPYREKCDGSSRFVNAYSSHNIPYRRLYNVIGHTYGGNGGIVASSDENIVTASSSVGAREHSAWTAGTTTFTVTKVQAGLKFNINAVISGINTIDITYLNAFAVQQTPVTIPGTVTSPYTPPSGLLSYWTMNYNEVNQSNITVTTINPGSGVSNAVARLTFNTFSLLTRPYFSYSASFLDYIEDSSLNNRGSVDGGPTGTFRPNAVIFFSFDGTSPTNALISPNFPDIAIVPFLSKNTAAQNLQAFVSTISNPFKFTILVNAFPLAGQYILYSDATSDFTGYFTVDGVGTDPALPGRTSVEFPIFTGNTTTQIAETMAEIMNNFEFSLPATSDLPALVVDSKVSWYINL